MSILSKLKKVFRIGNGNKKNESKAYKGIPPNFTGKTRGQNPFRLNKLPIVAMIEVIKIMTVSERIRLALTSKKMKKNVSYTKYKMENIDIHIRDEVSNICIEKEQFTIFCGQDCYKPPSGEMLRKRELTSWISGNNTIMDNICCVLQNISEIIEYESLGLGFYIDEMDVINVSMVLSDSRLKNWKRVIILGEKIRKEEMDLLMNEASERREIHLENLFPEGYNHENAFKYNYINYVDARWVRVENLFSLKNSSHVIIGNNVLTSTDANIFLKYWIQSDFDMFESIVFKNTANVRLDFKVVSNDIIILKTFRNDHYYYVVAANPLKTARKATILWFFVSKNGLCFRSSSPEDPVKISGQRCTPFSREFSVLTILNQKKLLEKELEEIEEQQENLTSKKQEILMEIQKIIEKLKEKGVIFVNGRAVLQPN